MSIHSRAVTFPFVQFGRDLHPSFLQLGFLHLLEVVFFTLTRDHVFPETFTPEFFCFQSVKEQKPSFAELDQILALAVLSDLVALPKTQDGSAEFCDGARSGSTPHSVLRPVPGFHQAGERPFH